MSDDPSFVTRAELVIWTRQRLRYPDPSPDAKLRALEHIRRVTLAHAHLLREDVTARLHIPDDLTQAEAEKIARVVKAYVLPTPEREAGQYEYAGVMYAERA